MKKKKIERVIFDIKLDTIPSIKVNHTVSDFASADGLLKVTQKINEIIKVLNEEKNKS